MSTKTNTEFLFPFNPTFFCFTVFLDQTILIIVNHFCETCTFLTSLRSKEKIKCGPTKAVSLLHFPYFQTLFSIRDLFQYPNSLSFKKWQALIEETQSDLSFVVSTILYSLSRSFLLVSIQSIFRCNQLVNTEKSLEEK